MKKIILGLVFSSIILGACGNTASSTDSNAQKTIDSLRKENSELKSQINDSKKTIESTTSSRTETDLSQKKTYGLNEEAILKDDQGNNIYSLKILKATTTSTSPDSVLTNEEHNNLIEVVYEYKNYNYPKAMSVKSQFLSAYDTNGIAGKDLGYMHGQTEVSSGGKASQSTMWFEMNSDLKDMNEIEIDYSNDFSLDFEGSLSFKVPLEH
ncbi:MULTISPECIES: hypothetical protein [unclassified Enterococcus]|uniref:hypothetical protein n=1 Tax=unclassified Enterococcus TaxID=2608891 RepID=UPI0013EB5845|nr:MULTISPECIES: hypothetical protein [unclassified Enterococcus]